MVKKLAVKLDRLEAEAATALGSGVNKMTVFGIVDMNLNVIRRWTRKGHEFVACDSVPDVLVPERLEPLLLKRKKYKVIYGGRGGAKSITAMDILAAEAKDFGSSVMCFREVQKSLKESVFKGLNGEIRRLGFEGFRSIESQGEIRHSNGALFSFWGLNTNLSNMKSLYGYKRFWTEEAETISQESLDTMGPTLRGIDDAEMWFTFNPRSSENPISKAFLMPFMDSLLRDGYYEDEYHLVIKIGYEHNPWFMNDKALRDELEKDRQKVKMGHMKQSKFDWIWNGYFNDDIDDAIIPADWFDACIDAHVKLGFKPKGQVVVSHDPSDTGPDPKGLCVRHGSVILDVMENEAGDANAGCDWATSYAIDKNADVFIWDCDGMGVALNRQVNESLSGKHMDMVMFKGSESPEFPTQIYQGEKSETSQAKRNEDVFKNRRAQYYWWLRDRMYATYRAVSLGEYIDPDDMISFSSTITHLSKLRAELCRIPRVYNGVGTIQIMTKADMKSKLKIPSPNLADAVMMSMTKHVRMNNNQARYIPRPISPVRR
ncbi:MAG: PBSX family phage terminase large subunit [Plesiomonas shigelloides]